mgnify:FL=1
MKPLNTLSKRLENITNENLLTRGRILSFTHSNSTVWEGTKRYSH